MKYEPVKDHAERKRIFAMIEQCEKEQTMSRYIDADAVTKEIKMDIEDDGLQEKMVFYRINEAPSIDIVRCKECRKVREGGGHANCNGYLYCRKWKTFVDEDDYCSWGEGKDK